MLNQELITTQSEVAQYQEFDDRIQLIEIEKQEAIQAAINDKIKEWTRQKMSMEKDQKANEVKLKEEYKDRIKAAEDKLQRSEREFDRKVRDI